MKGISGSHCRGAQGIIKVWVVVVPPVGSHVKLTKWIFKRKTDADEVKERFKSRLVACGNEKVFGFDFGLTFAVVMKRITVRVFLVFALSWGVPARHGDAPNAYVKADTEQHLVIYLETAQGMEIGGDLLRKLGVSGKGKLTLRLRNHRMICVKRAGCGATCCTPSQASRAASHTCIYTTIQWGEMILVSV